MVFHLLCVKTRNANPDISFSALVRSDLNAHLYNGLSPASSSLHTVYWYGRPATVRVLKSFGRSIRYRKLEHNNVLNSSELSAVTDGETGIRG